MRGLRTADDLAIHTLDVRDDSTQQHGCKSVTAVSKAPTCSIVTPTFF